MKGIKTIKRKKIYLIFLVIFLLGLSIASTFLENNKLQENINLAFYIDNVEGQSMPTKGSGYVFDPSNSVCTNDATIEFNHKEWSIKISNLTKTRTKCNLYFKEEAFADIILSCDNTAANCLLNNSDSDKVNLAYDGTVDNNLRYIGKNPNNYVKFNNELWRIIGVMNNIDDGNGNKSSRLKIIRNDFYKMAWDSNGLNDWSKATSQIELNTTYYENMADKNMIDTVVWNLGGAISTTQENVGLVNHWYGYERGDTVFSGRPITWKGKIALMYPSDYGYATSGGATFNREACLAKELYSWRDETFSDCKNNDWLYNSSLWQWTLTPMSSIGEGGFGVNNLGYVSTSFTVTSTDIMHSSLYLKPNIKITNGIGTSENPFILEM